MFYSATGIICSLFLAKQSDTVLCRKKLIQMCCVLGVIAGILFAFSRDYLVLLLVGCTLVGLASAATPQLFAFAKDHAQFNNQRIDVISTFMRASYSMAWVLGPPAAFLIAATYGFGVIFCIIALIFSWAYRIVSIHLPPDPKQNETHSYLSWELFKQNDLKWLFISTTLMWVCNSAYLFSLPLFVDRVLDIDVRWSGAFLGFASLLEFPIMLAAGYFVILLGKHTMMIVGAVCGVSFFISLLWVDTMIGMMCVQALNAIFIGMLGGIGISYYMDVLPQSSGVAATLFTTSARIGAVIGGGLAGITGYLFDFSAVFVVTGALAFISLLTCLKVHFHHKQVVMETLP